MQVAASFVGFTGSFQELREIIIQLENKGFDTVSMPDDLWLRDIFAAYGNLLTSTEKIKLGYITNPYSRHPVLVARATATLGELAPDRVRLCYCAGGSFTLQPLDIPRWDRPLTHIREAIMICRGILSKSTASFHGKAYKIDNIKLGFPFPQTGYEIHIAGRGMGVLSLIGELADGGLITPITPQYEQDVIQRILALARTHDRDLSKINLETTLTYTSKSDEDFKTFAVKRIANVIKDTPLSILEAFRSTIGDSGMEKINLIQNTPSVEKAIPYVTEDIASLYYDVTNNPETVMRIAKQQANKGYSTMHFVIPPGEEKEVVSRISQDLAEQIHAIPVKPFS